MNRAPSLTLVFLAGLAIGAGSFTGSAASHTVQRAEARAADLAAIEKLHKADIEATLSQDTAMLTNLWSEDCVRLGGPGPAIVGKKAMQEVYEKFRTGQPEFRVLKYVPEIKDVQLADGWAIEWGYSEATVKMSAGSEPITVRAKGLRVLKRQADGSWKLARVAEIN